MVVGVLSCMSLVGCGEAQDVVSNDVVETPAAREISEENQETENGEQSADAQLTEEEVATTTFVEEVSDVEVATEQIDQLSGFIGKTAHDVNLALGQPSTSKKIENSQLIAANYYKVDFCDEVAKVEVDFDVDTQKVNYVSFTIMSANDLEATKELFVESLTQIYGESTVERYMDVKGRQRRDWNDGTLNFDLKYYQNNITLDIYPLDK